MSAKISGYVLNEKDKLENISICLFNKASNTIKCVKTNKNGYYEFSDIDTPSSYIIYENVEPEFKIKENEIYSYNNIIGNKTKRQIPINVDNDSILNNINLENNNFLHDTFSSFDDLSFGFIVSQHPHKLFKFSLINGTSTHIINLDKKINIKIVAFNPVDRNLWGINTDNNIIRISKDGKVVKYDFIKNLPKYEYNVCTISDDGYMYIYCENEFRFFIIDVNINRITFLHLVDSTNIYNEDLPPFGIALTYPLKIKNWSFNPSDKCIYFINSKDSKLLKLNPIDAKISEIQIINMDNLESKNILFDVDNNLFLIDRYEILKFNINKNDIKFIDRNITHIPKYINLINNPLDKSHYVNLKCEMKSSSSIYLNDNISYEISINNIGTAKIDEIDFLNLIPHRTTLIENSLYLNEQKLKYNSKNRALTLKNLELDNYKLKFSVKLNDTNFEKNIVNECIIICNGKEFKVNKCETEILYPSVNLKQTLDKQNVYIGDIINYSLTLENNGMIDVDDIKLENNILYENESVKVLQKPKLIKSLKPGEKALLFYQILVNKFIGVENICSNPKVSFSYLSNLSENEKNKATVTSNEKISKINIAKIDYNSNSLVKSADKTSIGLKDILTYNTIIKNIGTIDALDVIIKENLQNCLEVLNNTIYINEIPTKYNKNNKIKIGTIKPNETINIEYSVKLKDDFSIYNIENFSQIEFYYEKDNTKIKVIGESNKINTNLKYANLANIKIYSTPKCITLGDIINYKIKIPNTGNIDAINVKLKNIIPKNTVLINDSIHSNTNYKIKNKKDIIIDKIPKGNIVNIEYQVRYIKSK